MRRIWTGVLDILVEVGGWIVILSVAALMVTVPAGVLAGGRWWLVTILTVPVITVLCFVGGLIAESEVATLVAGVVGWVLAVAAGLGLLVSGIDGIVNFEPECVPSETVECRWLYGVSDAGEASVAEQRRDAYIPIVMYQVVPGSLLLLLMGWFGFQFVQDRRPWR